MWGLLYSLKDFVKQLAPKKSDRQRGERHTIHVAALAGDRDANLFMALMHVCVFALLLFAFPIVQP
jgi:hypothetical protein